MIDRSDAAEGDPLRERLQWRRIASILGLVVLVLVVLPFVVYSVPQLVGAEHSYVVLSGSMSPTIEAGDVIIVDSVGASAIEEGDVITYRRSGDPRPTTHRVIDVVERDGGRYFETKGDGNPAPDRELVAPGNIEGRVMSLGGVLFAVPLVGYVIGFAGTTTGFLALFVVPVAALVVLEIRDVIAAARPAEGSDEPARDGDGESIARADGDGRPTGAVNRASEGSGGGDGSDGSAISFRAHELRLGLAILGAFLAYSLWVSVTTREIWSFAVTGSVATTFLLLAGLYMTGGSRQPSEDDGVRDAEAGGRPADTAEGVQDDSTATPFDVEDENVLLGSLYDPPTTEDAQSTNGTTATASAMAGGGDRPTESDGGTPAAGEGGGPGGDTDG